VVALFPWSKPCSRGCPQRRTLFLSRFRADAESEHFPDRAVGWLKSKLDAAEVTRAVMLSKSTAHHPKG
jgi:hypothetical protein